MKCEEKLKRPAYREPNPFRAGEWDFYAEGEYVCGGEMREVGGTGGREGDNFKIIYQCVSCKTIKLI